MKINFNSKKVKVFGILTIAIIAIVIALTGSLIGYYNYVGIQEANGYPTKLNAGSYYPPNTEYKFNTDNSIPYSMEGQEKNPDRGFRMETYITLGSNKAYPGNEGSNSLDELNKEISIFGSEYVNEAQVYVYLIEYYNKPLDEKAFAQLTAYFEKLRDNKINVLLRFAYEYTSDMLVGPTTRQIEEHCKQLKGWFQNNSNLVADTLYAMQLGMIGLWGEGHGNVNNHSVKRIAEAVYDMTPEPYTIMARYPQIWNEVNDEMLKRFSLHDDFLVGIEHKWGLTVARDSKYYKSIIDACKSKITDGEMPWGSDTTVPNVDYRLFLKQVADYGLTTLSLKHNYLETEGKEYHLKKWQSVYVKGDYLMSARLPFAPFSLENGKISVYDYLSDHLGYLMAASNIKKTSDGYQFILTNYGLNAPHDYEMVIKLDEGEFSYKYDLSMLSQFGQKAINVKTAGKRIEVIIRHKNNPDKTIKLANDIPFINGWNDLGYVL